MPFDEEDLDPHGECAAEIERLRVALGQIASYRMHSRDDDGENAVAMERVAKTALG